MIMEKIVSFLIAIWLIFCPFAKSECTLPVTVEGAVFGGESTDQIPLNLEFDSRWITSADNSVYNNKLAAFSAVICADSYYREKDLKKGTQNRVVINGETDEYNQTALLKKLGYTDVRFIETYKEKQYSSDTNDSATILIGYRKVNDKYDSYIVALRGCFSIGERLSIFDIGSDSEEYTALTGKHDEWQNTDCFKGLNVAVNRAEEFIKDYMALHDSPECSDCVLVTGHSRGAVLANLIGADFERNKSLKSYTYTFNAMPAVSENIASGYRTIFNLFDSNDYYVNPLPFANEKVSRFGKDIVIDISGSRNIKGKLASVKGREDYCCLFPEVKAEYDKLFGERFPDRKSLYKMGTYQEFFDSYEKALERKAEIESVISGFGISDFCKISDIGQAADGKYYLDLSYCSAALLFGFAQIQAYGQVAYDAFLLAFAADEIGCKIAKIQFDNLDSIAGGHLIINGYVLSQNIKCIF